MIAMAYDRIAFPDRNRSSLIALPSPLPDLVAEIVDA
jgi:hypothetical protein